MTTIRSVCVFCGSSSGAAAEYGQCARRFGELLAANELRLVYGGGKVGLMGILADAVLAAGGEVIGVIPRFLEAREVAHPGLTDLQVVDSMHERKQRMFELSEAACALPGGLGTLDETIEVVTWRQLGLHDRLVVVVNLGGYWDALRALTDRVVEQGFAHAATRALFRYVDTPEDALAALLAAPVPARMGVASTL